MDKVCKIPIMMELKFHERKSLQVTMDKRIGFILEKPFKRLSIEKLK